MAQASKLEGSLPKGQAGIKIVSSPVNEHFFQVPRVVTNNKLLPLQCCTWRYNLALKWRKPRDENAVPSQAALANSGYCATTQAKRIPWARQTIDNSYCKALTFCRYDKEPQNTLQRLFLPSIAGHQQVFLVSEGTSTLSANFPSSENGFILLFLKQGIGGIT